MSFINEHISHEDVVKYGLEAIDAIHNGTHARDWTIDRTRGIYLRNIANGREQDRSQTIWTFFWKGDPLTLRLDLLDATGKRGEPGWSHWRLVDVNGSFGLPHPLKPHQREIIDDLREVLVAYKCFGIFSNNSEYRVTLDFADGIVI